MRQRSQKIGAVILTAAAVLLITGHILAADIERTATDDTPPPASDSGGGYVVKSYSGRVAVYTDGFAGFPAIETDIAVEDLRAYDRKLLETGISVGTYEEVLSLFEDFGHD